VPGNRALERELAGTLAGVFAEVRVWPVLRFNHIVIGLTELGAKVGEPPDPRLAPLVSLLRAELGPRVPAADDEWTDDHAPVEWITDRMIIEYAARGGDFDEAPLPTAP
jgi:hypothetical protein